jgi:hypothetical protein
VSTSSGACSVAIALIRTTKICNHWGTNTLAGMQSGTLTAAGRHYSDSLAEFLKYEQETDLVAKGKEILVLTGTCRCLGC